MKPTQVVELRNRSDHDSADVGVLVVFVLPQERLSVEDSIGPTTFETIRINDLDKKVWEHVITDLSAKRSDLADAVAEVSELLLADRSRFDVSHRDLAAFALEAARIADGNPKGKVSDAVGAALPAVGLIPDRELLEDPETANRRLQLNRQQMETLTQPVDPPERIRQLPIDLEKSGDLAGHLLDVIRDAGTDRYDIAAELGKRSGDVDLSRWEGVGEGVRTPDLFVILRLVGDFDDSTGESVVKKDTATLGVEYEIKPAPASYPDGSLRLEVLRLAAGSGEPEETGVVVVKKKGLPRKSRSTMRKKVTCGGEDSDLRGPEIYIFRLSLLSFDGTTIASFDSDYFRVGDVEESPPQMSDTESIFHAYVSAIDRTAHRPGLQSTRTLSDDGDLLSALDVRFEEVPGRWLIQFPRRLADLEAMLLEEPRTIRGFELELGTDDEYRLLTFDTGEIDQFLDVRAALFDRLTMPRSGLAGEDLGRLRPNLALSDLVGCADDIIEYISMWNRHLATAGDRARAELLDLDRLVVRDKGEPVFVALSALHPVRLAWRLQYEVMADNWQREAALMDEQDLLAEARELSNVLGGLLGDELPLVIEDSGVGLRYRSSLPGGWCLWAREGVRPRELLESRFYRWLEVDPRGLRLGGEQEVLGRIHAYLHAHPYVRNLVVNVVRPGRADFVLRMMGRLSATHDDLRFTIRLFGEGSDPHLGEALDDFMIDPEGGGLSRELADGLTRVRGDSLRPTVAFSKHDLEDLRRRPEHFPAHVSIFLDYFDLEVLAVEPPTFGRSIFGGGVVISAYSTFQPTDTKRGTAPQWMSTAIPRTESQDPVDSSLRAHSIATATALGATNSTNVPAVRLSLDIRAEALLNAVHESSDWVVIVDPVFSDQYLGDFSRENAEETTTRYVVDTRDARSTGELRNVVVSSKLRREQAALLVGAAQDYGLELGTAAQEVLLNGLHLLGAGLGLRMLADGTRRKEALSLSLAASYLAEQGFLRHALVIPLDEHGDLFSESRQLSEIESLSRTDLLVVRFDPTRRRIDTTLVEVKVRSQLGGSSGVPTELLEEIEAQLVNTEMVVTNRLFGVHLRTRPESLPAALRSRRLITLLRRHLERSHRHGFLPSDEVDDISQFIDTLDEGLTFSLESRGLVFSLNGPSLASQRFGGISIDVVGSSDLGELLSNPNPRPTVIGTDGRYLHTVLGAPSQGIEVISMAKPIDTDEQADSGSIASTTVDTSEEPGLEIESVLSLQEVDLIGNASTTSQFSVLGSHYSTAGQFALDLGGTNVITVFGVQGSGKSYTVGSLIEGGLLNAPRLGPLPQPLATVVFHYSADATYRSEFATLSDPNDDPDSSGWLQQNGLAGKSVHDVVVLASERQLETRRLEYPGARVEPLTLAPSELTLGDWKLLMGIEGGKQMYAKELALVLRDLGKDFSGDQLRERIDGTDLSKQQKSTAKARVRFVEEYLHQDRKVVDWLAPGRLLIIDVRDELIDKDEALSIFMVLLNRFAGAGTVDADRFNKMVVFDEAHKYMSDTSLTDAINEAVREMRHKGITLVIASQDPLSIPSVVIELSTVIITHRMSSPAWLRTLKNSSQAFQAVKPGELAALKSGQALLWSAGGSARYRVPQKVQTRQRMTKHGGGTVRVDGV